MDLLTIGLFLLLFAAALIIFAQRKELAHLREVNEKLQAADEEEWIKRAREKLRTHGNVKTVKYVRKETGMSLVDAKLFVDGLGKS